MADALDHPTLKKGNAMLDPELKTRLDAASARLARGQAEAGAGADERAQLLAAEADRRGRGGITSLAEDLGITQQATSAAVARGRTVTAPPGLRLPEDTLSSGLAAERAELEPLTSQQWQQLAHLVRGIVIDAVWVAGQPGPMLAAEITDAYELSPTGREELATAAAGWSRFQALAVIDACQQHDLGSLPTTDE